MNYLPKEGELLEFRGGVGNKIQEQLKRQDGVFYKRKNPNCQWVIYDLKCSTCGYIPDEDDIIKTNYHLSKCSCGQENVCDLCLMVEVGYRKPIDFSLEPITRCPTCFGGNQFQGSRSRKFWLENEYK